MYSVKGEEFVISLEIQQKWQDVTDLLSELIGVPYAFILKCGENNAEVLAANFNNPQNIRTGNKISLSGWLTEKVVSGESVVKTKSEMDNGHHTIFDKSMVSYLGFPLNVPGGKTFGTLCIYDSKENLFSDTQMKLLSQFRYQIEQDLLLLKKSSDEKTFLQRARESENKYLAIFNSTGTANAIFSPEGILQLQNQMSTGFLGKDGIGLSVFQIFGEVTGKIIFERIKAVVCDGIPRVYETSFNLADGEKWFRTTYHPIFSDDGRVISVQMVSLEITEIKRSQAELLKAKELAEKNELLNLTLFRLLKLSENHTIPEVLEEALSEAKKLTSSSSGFYYYVDESNHSFFVPNGSVLKAEDLKVEYLLKDTVFWAECIHQREPVIYNNYMAGSKQVEFSAEKALFSRLMVVPVIFDDKVKIIFGVVNKPTVYIQDDVEIVRAISNLTWETVERKMAELRAIKLLKAAESSSTSIVITDKSGNIEYANPFFTQLTGYTKEEYLGSNPRFLKSGDQTDDFYKNLWNTITSGETWQGEFCNKKKNGEIFWENAIISPVTDEFGEIANFVAVKTDITERKNSEIELHKWSNVFKSAKWGITIGSINSEEFEIYNPAFAEMYGYDNQELLGMKIQAVFAPEVWPDLPVNIQLAHEKGHHLWESVHVRKDGSRFPVLIDVTAVKDDKGKLLYRVVNVQDISERKFYENELVKAKEFAEQSEEKLRSIIESTNDFIWTVDPVNFGLQTFNSALFNYFYKHRGIEIKIGDTPEMLVPQKVEEWKGFYQKALEMGQYKVEYETVSKTHFLYLSFFKLERDNKTFGISVFGHDISSRKSFENDLIRAKERAEESDRLKTAFIQNMSHEIRTPMNAIMGFSELMGINFDNKEKLEKYASVINQRSNDLLRIIDDLLDIARIESGQMKVYLETFELKSVFDELRETFSLIYRQKIERSVNFQIVFPQELMHKRIRTDKQRFKQIFTNLINNAFKFTERGKVEFGCTKGSDNALVFYVSDTGIGIQEDKLGLIFTRFTQLHDEIRRAHGGNGLGLSIVKGLLELLNGQIWVESLPGKGSSFYFTLKNVKVD